MNLTIASRSRSLRPRGGPASSALPNPSAICVALPAADDIGMQQRRDAIRVSRRVGRIERLHCLLRGHRLTVPHRDARGWPDSDRHIHRTNCRVPLGGYRVLRARLRGRVGLRNPARSRPIQRSRSQMNEISRTCASLRWMRQSGLIWMRRRSRAFRLRHYPLGGSGSV
jgi:hypothetical protein